MSALDLLNESAFTDAIDDAVDNETLEFVDGVLRVKDDGISTAKIADSAITTAKLASNAVIESSIADDAISTAKIQDEAVTDAKISSMAASKLINPFADIHAPSIRNTSGSGGIILNSDESISVVGQRIDFWNNRRMFFRESGLFVCGNTSTAGITSCFTSHGDTDFACNSGNSASAFTMQWGYGSFNRLQPNWIKLMELDRDAKLTLEGAFQADSAIIDSSISAASASIDGALLANSIASTTSVAAVDGNFSGALSGNSIASATTVTGIDGTFTGALFANSITSTTSVTAVDGTFTGILTGNSITSTTMVDAVDGNFSGALTSNSITSTSSVTAVDGSFTGTVTANTISANNIDLGDEITVAHIILTDGTHQIRHGNLSITIQDPSVSLTTTLPVFSGDGSNQIVVTTGTQTIIGKKEFNEVEINDLVVQQYFETLDRAIIPNIERSNSAIGVRVEEVVCNQGNLLVGAPFSPIQLALPSVPLHMFRNDTGVARAWIEQRGTGFPSWTMTRDENKILHTVTCEDNLVFRAYNAGGTNGFDFRMGGTITTSAAGVIPTVGTSPTTAFRIVDDSGTPTLQFRRSTGSISTIVTSSLDETSRPYYSIGQYSTSGADVTFGSLGDASLITNTNNFTSGGKNEVNIGFNAPSSNDSAYVPGIKVRRGNDTRIYNDLQVDGAANIDGELFANGNLVVTDTITAGTITPLVGFSSIAFPLGLNFGNQTLDTYRISGETISSASNLTFNTNAVMKYERIGDAKIITWRPFSVTMTANAVIDLSLNNDTWLDPDGLHSTQCVWSDGDIFSACVTVRLVGNIRLRFRRWNGTNFGTFVSGTTVEMRGGSIIY